MRMHLEIGSASQMRDFGISLAAQLRMGDLLLLDGPLGAGKTFLTQHILRALNVQGEVTSPTFVMMKSYQGDFSINHIDAYRLLDLVNPRQAFEELDIDFDSSITIVEWGAGFDLTGEALHIGIELGEGEQRTLTLEGVDARWGQLQL